MFFQAIHPTFFQWKKSQKIPPEFTPKRRWVAWTFSKPWSICAKSRCGRPGRSGRFWVFSGTLVIEALKVGVFLFQETWRRFCGFFCQVDWWVSLWYLAWPKDSSTNDDSMGKCLNPRLVSIVMSFSSFHRYGKKPHTFSSVCFIHVQISFFPIALVAYA